MHTKKKGNIGQFAAALTLSQFGFSVFTEEGDISTIDLIAEKNGRLYRFQCKAIMPVDGKLTLSLVKSGLNYRRKYKIEEIDFFSLYDLQTNLIYFIPSNVLNSNSSQFVLRLDKPKNNMKKGINNAVDYLPDRILRDYTDSIPKG